MVASFYLATPVSGFLGMDPRPKQRAYRILVGRRRGQRCLNVLCIRTRPASRSPRDLLSPV